LLLDRLFSPRGEDTSQTIFAYPTLEARATLDIENRDALFQVRQQFRVRLDVDEPPLGQALCLELGQHALDPPAEAAARTCIERQ
jgi:hypothetical protein